MVKIWYEISVDGGFIVEIRKSFEAASKRREYWEREGASVQILEMRQTVLGPMGVIV